MKHFRFRNTWVLITFVTFLLTSQSCDPARVYEEWNDFDTMVWHQDSLCQFCFEIADTSHSYDLRLGIRNNNRYPFQNLWIISAIQGPDSLFFQDTIPFMLANKSGQWIGERSASVYTYMAPMYSSLRFYVPGKYTISLSHGMNEEALKGMISVGVRVEKDE